MSGPFSDQGIAPPEITAAPGDHKPLTVVQLIEAERIGGAEYAAMEVSRAVIGQGGRALIGAGGAMAGRARIAGAETFAIQTDISALRRGRSVSHLVEALKGLDVDVIHARSAATAVIGRAAAEALGARFVVTLHAAPSGAWLKGAAAKALAAADRVIAVSDDLAGRVAAPNLVAIPRGADMEVFAEEVVSAERTIKLTERWGLAEETRPIVLAPGRLAGC